MKKTILITGCNRGIGLELSRSLSQNNQVIAVCRKKSDELSQLDVQIEEGIDVSQLDSIQDLRSRLGDQKIDTLINNAGIGDMDTFDTLDWDKCDKLFQVNSLGPLKVTQTLLPLLNDGAKIAMITSRMGSIGDCGSGRSFGYRMSKTALNIAGVCLAHEMKEKGFPVALIHPGFVKTDMTSGKGDLEPPQAAAQIIDRIENDLNLETTGSFWHSNGEILPW